MLPTKDSSASYRLRDLLPHARLVRDSDTQISSCATDPRQCQPGSLYVALTTDDDDGHEAAELAVRRGASAVLAERLLPVSAPLAIVRDTRAAYGQVAHALAGDPSQALQVFTVAGGPGKTAVAVLLESILVAAGSSVAWRNSLATFDGQEVYDVPSHEADVGDMARWLRQSASNGCQQAIVEVSARQLAAHGLAGLRCDVAVLQGGLRMEDVSDSRKAITRRLCQRLGRQLKDHAAVVSNLDHPATIDLFGTLNRPLFTAGLRNPGDVTATILERHPSEQTFLLQAGPESIAVRTTLLGDHQVSNCLSAAAAAILAGVDLPTIARGLEKIFWLPGQLERLECGQPFNVYIDAGSTPEEVELALRSVRKATSGRVIAVCGAKEETPSAVRARLGHVLERCAHVQVLTNDNPGDEAPLEIIHDLLDGFTRPEKALVRPDRAGAIAWALSQARPGDAVVLCGKAFDEIQRLADGDLPWDDRERARQWLYRNQSATAARPRLRVI